MIALTEAQARDKRCCGPEGCGETRWLDGRPLGRFCIGSACMAWEWDRAPGESLFDPATGDRAGHRRSQEDATGYCGLVGP